ncbi:MAG: trigger factor [Armatimonadota bacterium]
MQVTLEQLDPCKVQLDIEVEADRVAETVEKVFREYAKHTTVPGFRKGKAPKNLVARYVSEESVRQRALEDLMPEAYMEALKEKDIDPYGDPSVEDVHFEKDEPLVFKALVPLPPKVELGDYKGIEAKREKTKITDEDVEKELANLQENNATAEKVDDRGVGENDIVIANMSAVAEGEEPTEPRRSLVRMGENIPGFDEAVKGLKVGERKTFSLPYPEDFEDKDLAGKTVQFDLSVEGIRERKVPELNDEFAKKIGNFDSFEAMRASMKEEMEKSAETAADREVDRKIVDEIVSRSEVCFPDVMVEHELHHDLQEIQSRLSQRGLNIEQYLKMSGKTSEEMLAELREAAERRIRVGLVLGKIAETEKIDVTDEDVEAEIERMVADSKAPRESVESYIEATGGKSALRSSLLDRKIFEYLRSISKIK